ncbi:SRPBCC family protein [Rhodoplanes sp. Z2-YC6860]|uniref:SRPBCC family protein n=1 Tax=Rhodoplanes sp. Z2-YC6860 TaxID=674703 RepID=UPI00078E38C2|nr:SRPBCC domain-containing protein [Rhodoplanes sp. Z2-YC6860]AMN43227.1 Activator of Hsp90 ATPase 1 family protein [Rhodoplanes sp. Z2-YC6860]
MTASRSIVIERRLAYPPDRVWRALTEGALIAQWLMANDFRAEVGHRFTFKAKPMGDWDGTVQCEVLACELHRLLRYSWVGGVASNQTYGSRLDSTVTFTLTPVEGGTHLKMEHAGFRSPQNDAAYDAMGSGWGRIAQGIERVLATL